MPVSQLFVKKTAPIAVAFNGNLSTVPVYTLPPVTNTVANNLSNGANETAVPVIATTANGATTTTTPTTTAPAVQTETPIYQQWWFWLIVVSVLGGGYFVYKKTAK